MQPNNTCIDQFLVITTKKFGNPNQIYRLAPIKNIRGGGRNYGQTGVSLAFVTTEWIYFLLSKSQSLINATLIIIYNILSYANINSSSNNNNSNIYGISNNNNDIIVIIRLHVLYTLFAQCSKYSVALFFKYDILQIIWH